MIVNTSMTPNNNLTSFEKQRFSKLLEHQYGHQIFENHYNDFAIYYYSIIFKNNKDVTNYHENAKKYFEFTAQSIDSLTLTNLPKAAKDSRSCRIVMYPESIPCPHYHGFIMINRKIDDKFKRKCIKYFSLELNDRLNREIYSYTVNEKILEPYRSNYINDRGTIMKNISYKLHEIDNPEEIKRVFSYNTKKFHRTCEYSVDNIIYAGKFCF